MLYSVCYVALCSLSLIVCIFYALAGLGVMYTTTTWDMQIITYSPSIALYFGVCRTTYIDRNAVRLEIIARWRYLLALARIERAPSTILHVHKHRIGGC